MLVHLDEVIAPNELQKIIEIVMSGQFVDGRVSAEGSAAQVKNNRELAPKSAAATAAGEMVLSRLWAHPLFELATLPHRLSEPLFNRHHDGMTYGDHLDGPIFGTAPRLRTDIAVTVFLSEPDAYDGGELVIDTDYGVERCKGGAGDGVVYPASTFHRVEPVTRGLRLAVVLWIQSMVRDPAKRKILFDLGMAVGYFDLMGNTGPYTERLRRCQLNLLRMWAEL